MNINRKIIRRIYLFMAFVVTVLSVSILALLPSSAYSSQERDGQPSLVFSLQSESHESKEGEEDALPVLHLMTSDLHRFLKASLMPVHFVVFLQRMRVWQAISTTVQEYFWELSEANYANLTNLSPDATQEDVDVSQMYADTLQEVENYTTDVIEPLFFEECAAIIQHDGDLVDCSWLR